MPKSFCTSRFAPLPLPSESGPLPIFHRVKARLGRRSSIRASVCERNTGKGKVELKKSAKRPRNIQLTADAQSLCSTVLAVPAHSAKSENKRRHHRRDWLFGLNRADANVSLSANVKDTEHGTINVKLTSLRKINITVHLKRLITVSSLRSTCSLLSRITRLTVPRPSCTKHPNSTSTGHLQFHHELEYNWNERLVNALYSIEAFQHVLSVRLRNNPLRITPKFQAPLWAGGETAPFLIWEREPKSGPGEIQLMRKPFKISYEFQKRRVRMYYLSKSGSTSKLSFDNHSIQIEQTLSHVLRGALVSTTSTLSSEANNTGVIVSATAPWGQLAAHGRPRSAFLISSEAQFDYSRRCQLRAILEAENLSRFAIRLGVSY